MTPITCACSHCVEMCRHSTCLPTPLEVQTLMERGYRDRLVLYRWESKYNLPNAIGPAPRGKEGITQSTTQSGQCTFHMEDGRCELHDLGLKPLEGRLAHHSRNWIDVRRQVLQHWIPNG